MSTSYEVIKVKKRKPNPRKRFTSKLLEGRIADVNLSHGLDRHTGYFEVDMAYGGNKIVWRMPYPKSSIYEVTSGFRTPREAWERFLIADVDYYINRYSKKKKSNPKKLSSKNKCLLQLGTIVDIEMEDGTIITPKKKFLLGWGNNNIHIVSPLGKKGSTITKAVAKLHKEFHGDSPNGSVLVDKPTMPKNATKVGLIKAITYKASGINSPYKKRYNYRHVFGDTGHNGSENQPSSKFPSLLQDKKGNLFIKRRRGNTYYVGIYHDGQAWIIG